MTTEYTDKDLEIIAIKINELNIKLTKLRELRRGLILKGYKEGKTIAELSRLHNMKHPNVSKLIKEG